MIIQTGLAQNCASKLAKYSQTKMEKNNRVIRNLLILVVFFAGLRKDTLGCRQNDSRDIDPSMQLD